MSVSAGNRAVPAHILILSSWGRLSSMAGGGGTQSDSALVAALLRDGYRITLVAPREGAEDAEGIVHPELRRRRFRPPHVPGKGRLASIARWVLLECRFAAHALRASRTEGRPDLVYGFGATAVPAAALVSRILSVPSIGKLFGTFLFPALENRRLLWGQFPEVLAFKSPVSALVVHDDGTRGDDVAAALGVDPSRVRFWRNGVDKSACVRAKAEDVRERLSINPDAPLLVSTCRHVAWKRVDRVVEMFAVAHPAVPEAVLVVTGDGPERTVLEHLAQRLGVAEHVIFTGSLRRDENLAVIAGSDLYCSCYEFSNVSSALLEALTCGVCVLATDSGDTADVIEDGVTGVVVGEDDDTALHDWVVRLLRDCDLRKRLGSAAGAWAELEIDDLDVRMRREVALVQDLLQRRSR